MRRPLASVIVAALSLAGCTVGPNYTAPNPVPNGQGGFVSAQTAGASAAEPPNAWWRLYNDPVLDGLIERAFTANTDLRSAEANLTRARAILSEARAGRLPSTALSGGATYGRSASANAAAAAKGGHAEANWTYDAAFDVSWQLDLFGRVRRAIQAARASSEAVAAARDAVRVTVESEVARAYFDGCAYAEQLSVARRNLELARSNLELTTLQRNAGRLSDLETARAATLVEQASSAIPGIEGERQAQQFALAALLGLAPKDAPTEATRCTAPPRLAAPIPIGEGASLLRRRPDIRQAERALAASTAGIGVATADLFPSVSLGGAVGTAASDPGRLLSRDAINFGVGPLITWTFPNVTAIRARIREARAEADAALSAYDGAVLNALKETEQALTLYGAELRRNAALARARGAAAEAYRLVQQRYNAGTIGQLDLITAEQTLISAEQSLAQSDQVLADDQILVFKALGGGWGSLPR